MLSSFLYQGRESDGMKNSVQLSSENLQNLTFCGNISIKYICINMH